ncbi:MAG: hypothetical protein QOI84_1654 [Solirubrobacterales bacterium]|nr:hypothetical protein [Solirubrobacterales bacterium]
MPPPADNFAARIFLAPALRAQPDRRLVTLVREGYESAFEEIVRRYARPLDRFAAAIVGGSSEDVTQEAFSKAHLALRGSETDIELRPWLYRIVRNTALNDLRDRPPATAELAETIPGSGSAAAEAERREEIDELMARLRALPDPQRAAIVMRELEGLSHDEIAAALGISGGGARQAIYRARVTLRNGLGMLVPLPLLRVLFDQGSEAAAGAGGAVAAAGTAAAAGGSTGAVLGGLGAGGALKAGLATALIAGSVGAGVAIEHNGGGDGVPRAAAAGLPGAAQHGSAGRQDRSQGPTPASGVGGDGSSGGGSRDRHGRQTGSGHGSGGGSSGPGNGGGGAGSRDGHSGVDDSSGHRGSGSAHDGSSGGGDSGSGRLTADDGSGGRSGSGGGSDDEVAPIALSGSDDSHSGSGSSGSGSGEFPTVAPAEPEEPLLDSSGSGGGDDGSGSGVSGSSASGAEIVP